MPIISAELQIPIVPVAITGAYAAMSSGAGKIKRGAKISVEFLPVIYPEEITPDELNELVKERIIEAKKG